VFAFGQQLNGEVNNNK